MMYDTAKAIGGISLLAGALGIASHLVGQFQIGSAPWETLVTGIAAVLFGGLLCLLGDMGKRLVRLEEQLSPRDRSDRTIQNENDALG